MKRGNYEEGENHKHGKKEEKRRMNEGRKK